MKNQPAVLPHTFELLTETNQQAIAELIVDEPNQDTYRCETCGKNKTSLWLVKDFKPEENGICEAICQKCFSVFNGTFIMATSFKQGSRVILPTYWNGSEWVTEERGTVDGPSGINGWIVRVDHKYRHDPSDDGIREVSTDQMIGEDENMRRKMGLRDLLLPILENKCSSFCMDDEDDRNNLIEVLLKVL
jgi:hypothetical protein